MMKKLGMLALVMGLVIVFAMPALAFTIDGAKGEKMYIGGLFLTDFGYWNRSKELTGTGSDQTQFIATVPVHSRVKGTFEVGNVGGYWELGNGGSQANTSGSQFPTNNYIETRKLYGWYKFGNCEFRAGKDSEYSYSLTPFQMFGVNDNLHIAGFGWGALYDNRDPQIRFTQNVSKQFGYMVTLLQPAVFTDSTRVSYSQIPRVAVKLMMNFGVVSLFPAVQYQNVKWDNLGTTTALAGLSPDDNMTSWIGILPVKVVAGPFTGTFQVAYGQNLNTFYPFESAYHAYYRSPTDGKIKNTTGLNGFIDLAYTAGPVTPHIYFGYDNAKNSDKYTIGDDNNTRIMYGASINYKVADNFYMVPELTMYDYGKTPGTASKADLGKEWMGGVQFQFVF